MADVERGERGERVSILEKPQDTKSLPGEIRVGFIKKVYGLLFYMLSITFAICTPFIFQPRQTGVWLDHNPWLPTTCSVLMGAFYLFNMCMIGAMCTGNDSLYQAYLRMFVTVPSNVVFLSLVSAVFGCVVGFVTLQYEQASVLFIFGLCAVLIVALTLFAVKTEADFTGMGAYIFVAVLGLVLTGFLVSLTAAPGGPMSKLYAGAGTVIFGWIIVYDTQKIFGQCTLGLGGGGQRQLQYSVDMYAFAAFQLYLDYINFLLYMLQLMGKRR